MAAGKRKAAAQDSATATPEGDPGEFDPFSEIGHGSEPSAHGWPNDFDPIKVMAPLAEYAFVFRLSVIASCEDLARRLLPPEAIRRRVWEHLEEPIAEEILGRRMLRVKTRRAPELRAAGDVLARGSDEWLAANVLSWIDKVRTCECRGDVPGMTELDRRILYWHDRLLIQAALNTKAGAARSLSPEQRQAAEDKKSTLARSVANDFRLAIRGRLKKGLSPTPPKGFWPAREKETGKDRKTLYKLFAARAIRKQEIERLEKKRKKSRA